MGVTAEEARRGGMLLGLVGAGIGGSLTPAMQEAEAAAQGIRCLYRRVDLDVLRLGAEALPELLLAAERMGFRGLNITYPCKQAVLPLLDGLSEAARALGAANTVVFEGDGRRVGHNTDAPGFAEGFVRKLPGARLGRVALVGAGGAGGAAAHALRGLGLGALSVFDADPARAEALAASLPGARAAASAEEALSEADGVVHATPTGMARHPGLPFDPALLRPGMWVAEVVYVPLETELLRAARARGCRVADGGGMAVFQAVHAFRLFAGLEPDAARMERSFLGLLSPPAP